MKQLRRDLLEDSSLLILFVCLSALPYVASLGFYCDDWRFLGQYTASPDQTFVGYCLELFSTPTRMLIRPIRSESARYVWTLLSVLTLAVSSLAYELVLPFFCLTIVTVWLRGQRLKMA
jgi:hypothetical protein